MKHIHFTTIMLMLLLMACSSSKQAGDTPLPLSASNIQPDSCMTDKQYKMRLDFVKDSMRIEARNNKVEIRYEYRTKRDSIYLDRYIYKLDTKLLQDSIQAIRMMYQDSMKAAVPIAKHQEKTNRTDIRKEQKTERSIHRQDEKTKRSKWWVWLIVGFTVGILVSNIKIRL